MDRLWTPWRYQYISEAGGGKTSTESNPCVFCSLRDSDSDEHNFVLFRAHHNFVVLNLYPYTSGHLLIVPFVHTADLDQASKESTDEMMDLAKGCQTILRETYNPHGFNLGMNLGRSAGAGVADHIHLHVLPRWTGDANFMTTTGETRVLPEDLPTTYNKLHKHFAAFPLHQPLL
ncbi:MAG: HIT domain-containing protein [Pyrinomonadaceae bacterium]|nr:HIT domain-containing protein [Pyrinomonadaceae bacterium]